MAFLNVSQRIRKLDFSILLRASIISVDVKLQNISCVTGCACLWVRLFINGLTGQFKTTLPVESCLQTGKVYVEITIHGESSTVDQFEDNYTTHSFPCFFFLFFFVLFCFFCFCFSVVRILVPKKFFCLIQTEIKSMAYILAARTAIIISPRLYSCLVSHKGNKLFKSRLKNFIFIAFFLNGRGERFM